MLTLSLFSGAGLLDMAFEELGFCVVRGPELIFGGDIRRFHVPAGKFDGVIGGPPCQRFSPLANVNRARYGEACLAPNLIPEFERVVAEAQPRWFLMENVDGAPLPGVPGYVVHSVVLNNRDCGGVQNRVRRFSFGTPAGLELQVETVPQPEEWAPAVTSKPGGRRAVEVLGPDGKPKGRQGRGAAGPTMRPLSEMARLQGLHEDFLAGSPFTAAGKRLAIANGVPLAMGRAVASAVRRAVDSDLPKES